MARRLELDQALQHPEGKASWHELAQIHGPYGTRPQPDSRLPLGACATSPYIVDTAKTATEGSRSSLHVIFELSPRPAQDTITRKHSCSEQKKLPSAQLSPALAMAVDNDIKAPPRSSSGSSEECKDKERGVPHKGMPVVDRASSDLNKAWLIAVKDEKAALLRRSCLDALLRENVFLAVLLFLEVADATRLGSCCSELQAALRAPRVQPLWKRWFESSGFAWWPYGGVCGASCRIEVDRDGFVLQQQHQRLLEHLGQQQQAEDGGNRGPPTGYKRFGHEGWCCQYLWNARALENWKRGCCVSVPIPTDGHKLFMVSVHPKGVCASRAEAAANSPAGLAKSAAGRTVGGTGAGRTEQEQEEQQELEQEQLLGQQKREQSGSPSHADIPDEAFFCAEPKGRFLPQRVVEFLPGAGWCLLRALLDSAVLLTAANDRVLCILEPMHAGAFPACSRTPKGPILLSAANSLMFPGGSRSAKDSAACSVSPRASYSLASPSFSIEHLEFELESLRSGGSGRKSRGKGKKNANPWHAGGGGAAEMRTPTCAGDSNDSLNHRETSSREAAAPATSPATAVTSAEQALSQTAAAVGAAAVVEEIAQLAIDGQLVHSLLLNFVFSQNAERVFAFDRWHREFFVWDLHSAVQGEPLDAAAAVNAHTDGILALDATNSNGSCRVLCGSRDESLSLYSIDPVVRLATYNGHQAEVSAVCWLRNGEDFSSFLPNEGTELFASGSYDGQVKIWDGRQGEARTHAGLGLTLVEHQTRITRLAGAWDGWMLVSGDVDGIVKASKLAHAPILNLEMWLP
ncbi:hypothetical protein ACSSS7_002843 [Eimeria intestinalis]